MPADTNGKPGELDGPGRGQNVRPRSGARLGATLLSFLTTGTAAMALFFIPCWYFYTLRCDDGCNTLDGWTGNAQAWQWGIQFWCLAVPGVLAALSVSAFLAARRTSGAAVALAVSSLLYAGWAVMFITGGHATISVNDVFVHPWEWLPYTVMVLGGTTSITIQRRRSEPLVS
jgi:hypothetical protein